MVTTMPTKQFNDTLHAMVLSEDGTYTAYSKEYGEHYHSTKDGALHESLSKHVIPVLERKKEQEEIVLLDICFGLGFNTLATLWYHRRHNLKTKLRIYAPELDSALIDALPSFVYPKEFEPLLDVICALSTEGMYTKGLWHVELFRGDAREYVRKFAPQTFDGVYQDAFSPKTNPVLWTREYFADLARIMKNDAILTTYSTALATRLALHENGFKLYLCAKEGVRSFTLASKKSVAGAKEINMAHKIKTNPHAKALSDANLAKGVEHL